MSTYIKVSMMMFSVIVAALIFYSSSSEEASMNIKQEAFIELKMPPEKFIRVNELDEEKAVDAQPAGVNFYQIDWPSDDRGSVYVDHSKYSFTIENSLGVMGSYQLSKPDRGIYTFNISGGMASQSDISHDEARIRFMDFLQKMQELGWRNFRNFSDARLTSQEGVKYALEKDSFYTMPLEYRLTLEQWMKVDSQKWRMYADGMFVFISFIRDNTRLDLDKPSGYFFRYEIMDGQQLAKLELPSDEMDNVKSAFPSKLQELLDQRHKKEVMLEEQGFEIDTSYSDPELKLD
ncbi:hypothetical protein PN836_006070 [Ningiella sp. W23]|uniref:hypothetical protein n=1 Tax=Ningiella sp. W23 TaxID=3023715 RepID=UPI0037581305